MHVARYFELMSLVFYCFKMEKYKYLRHIDASYSG